MKMRNGFTPLETHANVLCHCSEVKRKAISCRNRINDRRLPIGNLSLTGFTLVELILVLVILGIVAVAAIPAFKDIQLKAKISATKSILASVRSAIANYRAISYAKTGISKYPSWDDVYEGNAPSYDCEIMEGGDMPDNPFAITTTVGSDPDIVFPVTTHPKGTVIFSGTGGWCYREADSSPGNNDAGDFWANSSTPGVNENNF